MANATDSPEEATKLADVPGPLPGRPWWHRTCTPEDRRRVLDDLAIRPVEHWVYRFSMMLTLSAIVAVMGLELNSAAVVIGAMLLAPLMQPVLATGACLSMALFGKALRAAINVTLATAWVIFLAYVIARFLPEREFTTEILSRTKPDIRDLVVALAAGTGGAYATVREDASASLPGVAVAVALVPPLAAIGITMEAGDADRARGALLLYTTNLAAIILVSIVVFVVTGFVPPRRLVSTLPRLALVSAVIVALVLAVAFPLYGAAQSTIKANNDLADAEAIVDSWLGDVDLQRTVRFDDDGGLTVELQGFEAPINQGEVEAALAARFPQLTRPPLVYWIRTNRATTTTTTGPDPNETLRAAVEDQVRAWLDESGIEYRLDNVIVLDGAVRIDAAGAGDPPSVGQLSERIAGLDGLTPRLNWTYLETIGPGDQVVSPFELVAEAVRATIDEWAGFRNLDVRSVDYDGDLLVVEVAGPRQPNAADLARLETLVGEIDTDGFEYDVFYIQRVVVTTTTSTLPPSTTTDSSAPGLPATTTTASP